MYTRHRKLPEKSDVTNYIIGRLIVIASPTGYNLLYETLTTVKLVPF